MFGTFSGTCHIHEDWSVRVQIVRDENDLRDECPLCVQQKCEETHTDDLDTANELAKATEEASCKGYNAGYKLGYKAGRERATNDTKALVISLSKSIAACAEKDSG